MRPSEMPIMAAPGMDTNRQLRNSSDIISTLAPTLQVALECKRLLSTASLFVLVRTYFIASQVLFASQNIAIQSLVTSRLLLFTALSLWKKAWWTVWDSRTTRRLRKKVVFEFFTLILGCGNSFCLLVFWPGWWILGFIGLMTWICAGRT